MKSSRFSTKQVEFYNPLPNQAPVPIHEVIQHYFKAEKKLTHIQPSIDLIRMAYQIRQMFNVKEKCEMHEILLHRRNTSFSREEREYFDRFDFDRYAYESVYSDYFEKMEHRYRQDGMLPHLDDRIEDSVQYRDLDVIARKIITSSDSHVAFLDFFIRSGFFFWSQRVQAKDNDRNLSYFQACIKRIYFARNTTVIADLVAYFYYDFSKIRRMTTGLAKEWFDKFQTELKNVRQRNRDKVTFLILVDFDEANDEAQKPGLREEIIARNQKSDQKEKYKPKTVVCPDCQETFKENELAGHNCRSLQSSSSSFFLSDSDSEPESPGVRGSPCQLACPECQEIVYANQMAYHACRVEFSEKQPVLADFYCYNCEITFYRVNLC
jgi:hypothetical protein